MTPDQQETLIFIGEYAATHGGIAPTYAEMIENLGGHSKSVYWRRVDRLIAGGYLRRSKGKSYSRSIYLTDQGREYLSEAGAFERIKRQAREDMLEQMFNLIGTHSEPGEGPAWFVGFVDRNRDELIDG